MGLSDILNLLLIGHHDSHVVRLVRKLDGDLEQGS